MTEPKPAHRKQPRACSALATAAIAGVAGGTLIILGYASLDGDAASLSTVGTLATLAVGALVAIAGGRNGGNGPQ